MDYEKALQRAKKKLPEIITNEERFTIPKVKGHLQGNKTILVNFAIISDTLGRKPAHLLKFLLKETASPGELKKKNAILGRKIPAYFLNNKIEEYAKTYVFCKECEKPDTKLILESKFLFLKCMACGAKYSIPKVKQKG